MEYLKRIEVIQGVTNAHIEKIDKLFESKEKEIMTI